MHKRKRIGTCTQSVIRTIVTDLVYDIISDYFHIMYVCLYETTDRSVISCSVEEHRKISIVELMIDSFLNEMEGVINV